MILPFRKAVLSFDNTSEDERPVIRWDVSAADEEPSSAGESSLFSCDYGCKGTDETDL